MPSILTRFEFDALPSDGKYPCPDCGKHQTHPFPGCGCPDVVLENGICFTQHINKWHHTCGFDPRSRDFEARDPDAVPVDGA